jgi:hypothetical protein
MYAMFDDFRTGQHPAWTLKSVKRAISEHQQGDLVLNVELDDPRAVRSSALIGIARLWRTTGGIPAADGLGGRAIDWALGLRRR